MRTSVHGHRVHVTACDGLNGYHRVTADGVFCGLVACDSHGWHTIPRIVVGAVSPPVCHAPTRELALASLIAEVVG